MKKVMSDDDGIEVEEQGGGGDEADVLVDAEFWEISCPEDQKSELK